MDIKRFLLYIALALVGLSLWNAWQIDYPNKNLITKDSKSVSAKDESFFPGTIGNENNQNLITTDLPQNISNNASKSTSNNLEQSKLIHVKTDVLDLAIDLKKGNIVNAMLLDYPVSVDQKNKPFLLLQNDENTRYVANSDLLISSDQTLKSLNLEFSASQQNYELDPAQNQLIVTLTGKNSEGIEVRKEFVFTKNSYLITVNYKIANNSLQDWKLYFNTQILRNDPKEDKSSIFHIGSYTGASYSNPTKDRYQKVSFSDMNKSNLDIDVVGGWIAMQQHYFLSAWVPFSNSENKVYTRSINGQYIIGTLSKSLMIKPQEHKEIGAKLYIGPEITSILKTIAPSLDLTVDYGILWFLSSLLFSLMRAIYTLVGNWGWSIVLVTLLIKLLFYRLSATSYKSMAGMRKLQPKLQALRERYGDDKAKISKATMELYKQEKVNPLGGCLPILIQIPVFIALYWVLLESVELRQAPFIFWIKDLASSDPYHVLPLIMGATMLVQQKLNPAPPDPVQAKMMMFLPLLFTGLFWNFPSGLVLYWIVNNTLSILQQWYITKKYADEPGSKPGSKSSESKKIITATK